MKNINILSVYALFAMNQRKMQSLGFMKISPEFPIDVSRNWLSLSL